MDRHRTCVELVPEGVFRVYHRRCDGPAYGCAMSDSSHDRSPRALERSHVPRVVVAIGANQGDAEAIVKAACMRLLARSGGNFRASGLYRSSPVDCPAGSPDFINAAVCMSALAGESPESLLQYLQQLEREFGRTRGLPRNSPRELDLDLIVFADEVRDTPMLQLPHPRGHLRRFVLEPVSEVAGDLVWPGLGVEVRVLCAALRARQTAGYADGQHEQLERLCE